MKKKIIIFGSTGSIGKNAIEIILQHRDKFEILALTANCDAETLALQANLLSPQYLAITDEKKYHELKSLVKSSKIKIIAGKNSLIEIAKIKCDLVISAIVGSCGIVANLEAIKSGSNIAIANKESIVCAGKFLIAEAIKNNVKILPIDSEHNAILQIFEKNNFDKITDIILTASGGPFFRGSQDFTKITVVQALKHPKWKMGKKISIDSATMMNKGLEMIEAFYLFNIKKENIKILIHPQSIIHGIVNYQDGSSLAMLSNPDMKTPISYCMFYPQRLAIRHKILDLIKLKKLDFFAVDDKKFPAVVLSRQALFTGGNAPIILNGANEIAVEKFLNEEISFDKITKIIAQTLNKIAYSNLYSINDVLEYDKEARRIASLIR